MRAPLLALCAALVLVGCRSSWEERVESVHALKGVRVDGQKLAEYLEPRMLLVVTTRVDGDEQTTTKACAAVVTTDGYVLTAAHVARSGEVRVARTVGEGASESARARVVWSAAGDDEHDLALLHVEGLRLPLAFDALGDVEEGARVVLGGYPGGALRIAISGGHVTSVDGPMFDHSAPGQQGDSGGPLIDARGRLVGIASAGYWTPFGGWEGVASRVDPAWLARTIAADRARPAR